jgi:hypothetical protein
VAHSNFKVANCFTVAIKYLLYRVNKMATSHKRKKGPAFINRQGRLDDGFAMTNQQLMGRD